MFQFLDYSIGSLIVRLQINKIKDQPCYLKNLNDVSTLRSFKSGFE